MEFSRRLSRLVIGSAALALILTACHGASSGTPSYLPTGSSGISTQQQLDRGIAPAGEEHGEMFSSCGHHVRIILAGIVTCRFHEVGDRDAAFTLKNHTQGLILISPMTGNRHTKFTITGLVLGTGSFTVSAGKGHRITVTVHVVL
jgi:hypothetical protein